MAVKINRPAIAHVRFEGRSFDLPLEELGVAGSDSDRDLLQAVARHLDIAVDRLHDCVVDRHETGNVTIRPAAVFG